jgi:hypothetical protein
MKYINNVPKIGSVPHPACAWWNKKSKKGTGKEQFIDIIKDTLS